MSRMVLALLLLSGSYAHADGILDSIKNFMQNIGVYTPVAKPDDVSFSSYKDYTNKVDNANKAVSASKAKVESSQKELADLEKQLEDAERQKSDLEAKFSAIGPSTYDPRNDADMKRLTDENNKYKNLSGQVEDIRKKFEAKKATIDKNMDALHAAENNLSAEMAVQKSLNNAGDRIVKLENTIAEQNLSMSLDEFENKIKDLGYEVQFGKEAVERVYDNSLLSEYLAQKMKKLLNSHAICDSVKQCSQNPQPSGVGADEIFANDLPRGKGGGRNRRSAQ